MAETKTATIPKVCRACDSKRGERCCKYGVKLSTARRGFDVGICYGRTVDGERSLFIERFAGR